MHLQLPTQVFAIKFLPGQTAHPLEVTLPRGIG